MMNEAIGATPVRCLDASGSQVAFLLPGVAHAVVQRGHIVDPSNSAAVHESLQRGVRSACLGTTGILPLRGDAVRSPSGIAVAIVGGPCTGATTISNALVASGWSRLSADLVPVTFAQGDVAIAGDDAVRLDRLIVLLRSERPVADPEPSNVTLDVSGVWSLAFIGDALTKLDTRSRLLHIAAAVSVSVPTQVLRTDARGLPVAANAVSRAVHRPAQVEVV